MTYDPNSDQEQQFFPNEQTDLPEEPAWENAPVPEAQQPPQEELSQEPEVTGAYVTHEESEDWKTDTGYRGKFSAPLPEESVEAEPINAAQPPQEEPYLEQAPEYPAETPEADVGIPYQEAQYPPETPPAEEAPLPFSDEVEEEVPPAPPLPRASRMRAVKKGRPRRKKGGKYSTIISNLLLRESANPALAMKSLVSSISSSSAKAKASAVVLEGL